jgi:hypothetical protein
MSLLMLPGLLGAMSWAIPSGGAAVAASAAPLPATWQLWTQDPLVLDVTATVHSESASLGTARSASAVYQAPVTFGYTLSNEGDRTVYRVALDNPLVSSGLTTCGGGRLPETLSPGGSVTCTATADLTARSYKDTVVATADVEQCGLPVRIKSLRPEISCPVVPCLLFGCVHHLLAKGTVDFVVTAPPPPPSPPPPSSPPPPASPPAPAPPPPAKALARPTPRPAPIIPPPPSSPPSPTPTPSPSPRPSPTPRPTPSPSPSFRVILRPQFRASTSTTLPLPITVLALLLPGVAAAAIAGFTFRRR